MENLNVDELNLILNPDCDAHQKELILQRIRDNLAEFIEMIAKANLNISKLKTKEITLPKLNQFLYHQKCKKENFEPIVRIFLTAMKEQRTLGNTKSKRYTPEQSEKIKTLRASIKVFADKLQIDFEKNTLSGIARNNLIPHILENCGEGIQKKQISAVLKNKQDEHNFYVSAEKTILILQLTSDYFNHSYSK
jgi:hypothetical protein